MEDNTYCVNPRATSDTVRMGVALAAVTDGVFAIGGGGCDEDQTVLSTVSYYDIEKNIWIIGYPQLRKARIAASCCVFKATVYVFCGINL